MEWSVYILDCDGRYYTGISSDPQRRFMEHTGGTTRGAKFTRAFPAQTLAYCTPVGTRSVALKVEARIKKLPRAGKAFIVAEAMPGDRLLTYLGLVDT